MLVALASRGIGTIHILNRTFEKAEKLARDIDGPFEAHGMDAFSGLAPKAGLVVNTTSIGMHGTNFDALDLSALPATALVTDIVYTPLNTRLLIAATAQKFKTVDGLGMLLHQAVPGFEAWFGTRPQVTAELRRAVEATLEH